MLPLPTHSFPTRRSSDLNEHLLRSLPEDRRPDWRATAPVQKVGLAQLLENAPIQKLSGGSRPAELRIRAWPFRRPSRSGQAESPPRRALPFACHTMLSYPPRSPQIGRSSCRERGFQYVEDRVGAV